MNRPLRNLRSGFTLLEVVLAIALSSVLLGLLTLAVDQYLVNVQASRDAVEHAQVARGVLRMIADDLRNAASAYHQDVSALQQLADAAASSGPDSEAGSGSDISFDSFNDSGEGDPAPAMGVTGDLTTLQVDVLRARLRVDPPEEFATLAGADNTDGPTAGAGVSTVRYSLDPAGGGLVRQEVSRDLALWEEQQGVTGRWDAAYRIVAQEVTAIEFRYSDGVTPLEVWDLDAREGENPRAVEVRVTLSEPINHRANTDDRAATPNPTRTYRMTIALPTIDAGSSGEDDSFGDTLGDSSSGSQQGGGAGAGSGGR